MIEMTDFQVCDRDLSNALLAHYLKTDQIAIDTETMGLSPRRDRLCLVQLCDSQNRVTVIKIERGQKIAENLQTLLESQKVVKVFHFARFDVAMLRYYLGINTNPIFCTKIASKLARTYTNKHGLKDLVLELSQVELDKTAQSSDWGNAANLSVEQLRYACNDVLYLLEAKNKLVEILTREERQDLASQCFQCIPVLAELDILEYQGIFDH